MTGPQYTVRPPGRVAGLRRNNAGYPIPYFVADQRSPSPDFRVAGRPQFRRAVLNMQCWVCGQRRPGGADAFVIGPMCSVNRVSADPPAHPECAEYSVQVCPFLARPDMVRREHGLDAGPDSMAGVPILRNPGVGLIWTTAQWQLTRIDNGWIFDFVGEPLSVSWWCQGRAATRAEVLAAIDSGMPLLREQCVTPEDHADLDAAHTRALKFVPALATHVA